MTPPTSPTSRALTSGELTVEALEAMFPGWHCWRAQVGGVPSCWMAIRHQVVAAFERLGLRHNTLMAHTAVQLRDLLAEQVRIDEEE